MPDIIGAIWNPSSRRTRSGKACCASMCQRMMAARKTSGQSANSRQSFRQSRTVTPAIIGTGTKQGLKVRSSDVSSSGRNGHTTERADGLQTLTTLLMWQRCAAGSLNCRTISLYRKTRSRLTLIFPQKMIPKKTFHFKL